MLQEIVLRNIHCATTHHACGHRYAPSLARICDTLVYAEEGAVHFSDGVKEFFVARGELLYIPAGVRGVSIFPDKLNCHRVFNFSVEGGTLFPDARVFSVSDALRALILTCADNREHMRIVSPSYYASCLYRMLYLLEEDERFGDGGILPAVRYIERNYVREEPVSVYAKLVCMSESAFRKRFVASVGMSPVAYRNRIRMQRVEELVAVGVTVQEAVRQVGFGSASFYYRLRSRTVREADASIHNKKHKR